jgi:hypothetical protein
VGPGTRVPVLICSSQRPRAEALPWLQAQQSGDACRGGVVGRDEEEAMGPALCWLCVESAIDIIGTICS